MKNVKYKHLIVLGLTIALFTSLSVGCAQQSRSTSQTAVAVPAPAASDTSAVPSESQQSFIRTVTADEALEILKENPKAILLDVRTEAEFAEGHIEGAQQLAVEDLLDRTDELPADLNTPIVVYCRSGRRSADAARQLAGLGYTTIYDLGGINSWPYEIVK